MGMYTEVFVRAQLRKDTPDRLLDWLDELANHPDPEPRPYDQHPFFGRDRWQNIFLGGGAVYHVSRRVRFRRTDEYGIGGPELIVHSSLKNYGGEIALFMEWLAPFVAGTPGEFLGYSLYEDAWTAAVCPDNDVDREDPILYFLPAKGETRCLTA